ncbi:MAG: tRNA pseudouridine(55) synthase TruB [Candidatus Nomurabacteria bacterium]|jgi:tRNA pseudouridine55 synthase|nr:tRNA pseudouridine(55) synthase TruB [Candidatus Nomurabacteria bacterium]
MILIDKPAGMTSFGVVARVRRVLTARENSERAARGEAAVKRVKVGHTGTLDPFATGLLILLTGKMTRESGRFLKLDKVYLATLRLGATSTTGDPEGEITLTPVDLAPVANCCPEDTTAGRLAPLLAEQSSANSPRSAFGATNSHGAEQLRLVLRAFIGKIRQVPPIYSAIKIGGRRAYDLARKGLVPEMPEREIEIYSIEVVKYAYPELILRVHCSSGTYIRTLAEDIGKKLGVGAYLTALRREKIGDYSVENAKKLTDFVTN